MKPLRHDAKLVPGEITIHPQTDTTKMVEGIFGSALGAVIPSPEQVSEIINSKLNQLRRQLFILKYNLDLPGSNNNRSDTEISKMRSCTREATSSALRTVTRLMNPVLKPLVYPRIDPAKLELARIRLNSLIEFTKQEIATFEAEVSQTEMPDGIHHVWWSSFSLDINPTRLSSEVELYWVRSQLIVNSTIYPLDMTPAITLNHREETHTFINPGEGKITKWLQGNCHFPKN